MAHNTPEDDRDGIFVRINLIALVGALLSGLAVAGIGFVGYTLWNQSIDIVRVEIQSKADNEILIRTVNSNKRELSQQIEAGNKILSQQMESNGKELMQQIDANDRRYSQRFDGLDRRLDRLDRRYAIREEATDEAVDGYTPSLRPVETSLRTVLRVQTRHAPETASGRLSQQFFDDVARMSNGEISIVPFVPWPSSEPTESIDSTGFFDCDMTDGSHRGGGYPAFKFVGDAMGGLYDPRRQLPWLYLEGGLDEVRRFYDGRGLFLVGLWGYDLESAFSPQSVPIAEFQKLIPSAPGTQPESLEKSGEPPIVMNLVDVFKALEAGIPEVAGESGTLDGVVSTQQEIPSWAEAIAEASSLHLMPSDQLVCDKEVWDALPGHHREILTTAMEALALRSGLAVEKKNAEAVALLLKRGIAPPEWLGMELNKISGAAPAAWSPFAVTPEAEALVDSHIKFLSQIVQENQ